MKKGIFSFLSQLVKLIKKIEIGAVLKNEIKGKFEVNHSFYKDQKKQNNILTICIFTKLTSKTAITFSSLLTLFFSHIYTFV
jgi:hypothetical protein